MYKVTWVDGKKLKTITSPKAGVAADLFIALRASRIAAHIWAKDGSLIK